MGLLFSCCWFCLPATVMRKDLVGVLVSCLVFKLTDLLLKLDLYVIVSPAPDATLPINKTTGIVLMQDCSV